MYLVEQRQHIIQLNNVLAEEQYFPKMVMILRLASLSMHSGNISRLKVQVVLDGVKACEPRCNAVECRSQDPWLVTG